ncbi:unnamed protein product [Discula destructiva]
MSNYKVTKEELAACFAAGVLLHVTVFRHGEWDAHSLTLLEAASAAQLVLALTVHELFSESLIGSARHVTIWAGAAVAGLYSSMLIYRAFFHRLRRFPGPFMARLSTFYMTYLSTKRGQIYHDVQAMHRKYGDYVRVGPSEISIADPKAFNAIHSATSQCERGPWYNILNPTISLQMVRDRKEHGRRRKAWDRAFSPKALRDYEARVAAYTDELLETVDRQARKGQELNASKWFNYYSFDIMGDLAFGGSFNMMKSGQDHYYLKSTHSNMILVGIFSRVIWLFPIFKATVGYWEYQKFQRFIRPLVKYRAENEPHVPDIFHWILSDYNQNPKPSWQEKENLIGDASLIVVAGSDTTAATLTCLFYHFAIYPDVYKKLQQEVDKFFADNDGDSWETSALGRLQYMQACIDESLRLFPPVASGLQRQTPAQGVQIGDTWIPGNTIVMTPTYTLTRDPRTFPQGDDFIPERWTTRTELVKDPTPNAPFSVGRFSCVGKQLGLNEVRRVTASMAHRYNVALAPGQTKEAFLGGLRDNFTLAAPKLDLKFSRRT